jgi:hypothetical protein
MGFAPLCTVGAAEFEPPASGRTALFSIAMEFDVFSSPLPEVAAGDVVQFVSGFSPDGVVVCATAATAANEAARIAAARREIILTSENWLSQIDRVERPAMTKVPLRLGRLRPGQSRPGPLFAWDET